MLIYDPDSRRAFTKDIIVGMNHKDFYPEYPILQDPVKRQKVVQNVWRPWHIDTDEENSRMLQIELNSGLFNPSRYIKQKNDLDDCYPILIEHMEWIKIY